MNTDLVSIDKKHKISLIPITNELIVFELKIFDHEHIKTFVLLLKECIEYININNFKKIFQYVNMDDYKLFKYSKIIGTINNSYIIHTPIDNLMLEYYQILNIQTL